MYGNGFSSGFQCCQRLDMANRCAVLCLPEYLAKVEGSNKQISNERARGVATNR